MEREAYEVGNLCFRDWEDGVKAGGIRVSTHLREALLGTEGEMLLEAKPKAPGKPVMGWGWTGFSWFLTTSGMLDTFFPAFAAADFANALLLFYFKRYAEGVFSIICMIPLGGLLGNLARAGWMLGDKKMVRLLAWALGKAGADKAKVIKQGTKLFDDALEQINKLPDDKVDPRIKAKVIEIMNSGKESFIRESPEIIEEAFSLKKAVTIGAVGTAAVAAGAAGVYLWSGRSEDADADDPSEEDPNYTRDKATGELYNVKSGDTLSNISYTEYGDPHKWPLIYLYNTKTIGPNPDILKTAQESGGPIIIPPISIWETLDKNIINKTLSKSSWYADDGGLAVPRGMGPQGADRSPAPNKNIFQKFNIFSNQYKFPVDEGDITGTIYGYHEGKTRVLFGKKTTHRAIDIGVPVGTKVYAPADGFIKNITWCKECGHYIVFVDESGLTHRFLHLSRVNIKSKRDRVKKGELIALSGDTGWPISGPHLHYDVTKRNGKRINPLDLFRDAPKTSVKEWKEQELNRLLLEKFNLGDKK